MVELDGFKSRLNGYTQPLEEVRESLDLEAGHGQRYLLHWPEITGCLPHLLDTLADNTTARAFILPDGTGVSVRLGEDWEQCPMPGLAVASKRYLAGGGQTGVMAVIGPTRMDYQRILPTLEYFSSLLGEGMSGQHIQEDD